MYFKQLEMTGFKSFADRTLVRLERGVSAVVGPNGCGKSNILDALRWALGEQRPRELRGSQMQDVIFNGSEDRLAMGMAEVSVTFDNSDSTLPVDFSEVEITRRVYRSGESEYLINKTACRLRDIQELFMDTGIGTHAYSMIGQGKMDLILSSKPEDRRFLFEEAAGVIKYKTRKKIAMRKLESADQNILRLKDIIAEVERQMRSLKRQVNAAIRYREYSAQLRELEIRSAWLKHAQHSSEIAELKGKFAAATDAYENVSAELSLLEARYEELGLNRLEVDRVLLARREGVHGIETEMEKLERQLALLRQQIEFADHQTAKAEQEKKSLDERAEAIHQTILDTIQRSAQIQSEIQECQSAFQSLQEEHANASERVTEADGVMEALRARSLERASHRTRTLTELEGLNSGIEGVDAQLRILFERQSTQNARREELAVALQRVRSSESEKQTDLSGQQAAKAQLQGEINSKTAELRSTDERRQTLREEKGRVEARLHSLRELRDAYEGFATGVRAIMGAKTREIAELPGIIGPAGDLLSTEKTYEKAIEAALGGNINNVIVENADSAKTAIDFLKKHSAGRVTFLPLDIIRGGAGDHGDDLRGKPGVIGPAIGLVQYDSKISAAVEYLLHSTIIVETLDDAIRLVRQFKQIPKLVTLDGEVVTSAGAVTGGRTRNESRGLLGRSAEIAELEQTVTAREEELQKIENRRQSLQHALAELSQQRQETDARETELRNQINALFVDIATYTTELDNLTLSLDTLKEQLDGLSAKRSAVDQQRREALDRATSLDSDDELLQRETDAAQEIAHKAREAMSALATKLADARVKQAELMQRFEESQRDEQRRQRELAETRQEAEQRVTLIAEFNIQSKSLEEEVRLNNERAKAFSESKDEARQKVNEAENQRQTLLDETDTIEKRLRELREHARASQAEIHRLEMSLRQNEDRIGFFQERILEEYNLALGSLTQNDVGLDEHDDETREKMITDLRASLQRMGEVNLMAIEEYEALETRYAFLVAQADDLDKAKEVLLGVVARSDKRIRELFMDTFQKVAENFKTLFRRLFNGGQARVFLVDENDPLESGIEIEARPPGKKPTSISLLSGGESAMTAIALLFSIFQAKPSPFCVLDEVDAPLDDANIGRFLNILEEFMEYSQFVVITHNKQTMARASALYGVTQQERGVSQLVAVRFDEVHPAESAA